MSGQTTTKIGFTKSPYQEEGFLALSGENLEDGDNGNGTDGGHGDQPAHAISPHRVVVVAILRGDVVDPGEYHD